MRFTTDMPKVAGAYWWRHQEGDPATPVVVFLLNNEWCVTGVIHHAVRLRNVTGLWCLLVPADEMKMGYIEGHVAASKLHDLDREYTEEDYMDAANQDYESSRAKQIAEGLKP